MKVEMWNIARLKPYPQNPRVNDGAVDALVQNIRTFGWRVPIIVDKDGNIVAGRTRLKAAEKLKLGEVPVHVAHDLTPEQAKAFRIAENRSHEHSKWDPELLPKELAELKALDFSIHTLRWSEDELNEIMAPPVTDAGKQDEEPEPPANAVSRLGDLWTLGEHRILCGDSTKPEDVAALMGEERAHLVLTDPPYGVDYNKAGGGKDNGRTILNDSADVLEPLLRGSLGQALAMSKPGACWYVAAPAGPQFLQFAKVLTDLGVWRQTLAWVKDSMVLGRSDYHYKHEAILYGWAPAKHREQEPIFYGWAPGTHRPPPGRTFTSVLEFPRPKTSREHPTMKPVALWCFLMEASTSPGNLVYEPFSDSGTTIIAAAQLGRRCRAIELDPKYVDVAITRWQNLTGKHATLNGHTFADVAGERAGAHA